mgnify:FL=1
MKNLFVWNTFMQWKPVAIKEQKVTENQVGPDGAATDKNPAPAEAQAIDQIEQGVSYEERWRIVQYFSDWIKNADVRIQMLLAVQGFIVAAYGALIPATEKVGNFWNSWTYIWTAFFVSTVIISFKIGFYQRPNMSVSGRAGNIFFYGSYNAEAKTLDSISHKDKMEYINDQMSTLAGIADKKFKNVQRLQSSVFMSAIFLVLFSAGFVPWFHEHSLRKEECLIQSVIVAGVLILVLFYSAIMDMCHGLLDSDKQ